MTHTRKGFWRSARVLSSRMERRSGRLDRRWTPRGGRRAPDALRTALFAAACAVGAASIASAAEAPAMKFGFDVKSAKRARSLGMPVSYGSLWVGSWNQKEKHGWGGIKDQLREAKAADIAPLVQWWYWGDDISPECVEKGCRDKYEGVDKNKATWYRMSAELADLIVDVMGPRSDAIVVVETEFNKKGIQNYEPFDGYLVDIMQIFHRRHIQVVLGFGNWDQQKWKTFDRAVQEADFLGAMALQSSIRDSKTYMDGAEMLLRAAKYNQTHFAKPTFVSDVAFSSYPEASYEANQEKVVRHIFSQLDELRAAGVRGIVWRMLSDDPKFDTTNYHGEAERHWGLLDANGRPKAAFAAYLDGMRGSATLSASNRRSAVALASNDR